MHSDYCMPSGDTIHLDTEPEHGDNAFNSAAKLKTASTSLGTDSVNSEPSQLWDIDPNHGMHIGPGYLGDAPHSLRTREAFRYYQPPSSVRTSPLSTPGGYAPPKLSDSLTLTNSHDPIMACIANLISRTFDAQRCLITVSANGLSYVVAESTRTLSLHYPHTHAPGDQLWLGAGLALPSPGGLCEHTVSLVPPPIGSNEPFLLEIPDLAKHPRYQSMGFIHEWPYARFFASSPLRTKAGVSIGTVCILDNRTRPCGLTGEEREALASFSDVVMDYLERKRESEDERKRQATEIALGRFIAEGFLEEDGGRTCRAGDGMLERRDGRVWSKAELDQRKRQEAQRRKRVEERRAAFQEERFAEMVRRQREREQKNREREEREKEDSERMRKDNYHAGCREQNRSIEMRVRREAEVEESYAATTMEFSMELKSLHEVELAHIEGYSENLQSMNLEGGKVETVTELPAPDATIITRDFSLKDKGVLPPTPPSIAHWNMNAPLSSPVPSLTSESSSYFSNQTQATSAFSPAGSHPPPTASTIKDVYTPARLPHRQSNYEATTSIEASFRSTFSRAAAWIHDAIDANVVFLDPDLEGFSDEPSNLHVNSDTHVPLSTELHIGTTATATYISSSAQLESEVRGRRPEWLRRCTGVLAHATSTGGSLSFSHPASGVTSHLELPQHVGFDMTALDEKSLADIVAENRVGGGGIVSLGCGAYPSLGLPEDDIRSLTRTEEVLPRFLPGVRSAIVVPLVAGEHSTGTMSAAAGEVFAVAVVWTCETTRTFCVDVEGRFVVGVARGIVAEVNRLNILNVKVTAADKAKSEFISSISHELRTPLHGILASAEFLMELEAPRLDTDQRLFVDTILSCANTLLETVNHVLEFQKLSSTTTSENNDLHQLRAATDMAAVGRTNDDTTPANTFIQPLDPCMAAKPSTGIGNPSTACTTTLAPQNTMVLRCENTDLTQFIQEVVASICLGNGIQQTFDTSLCADSERSRSPTVIIDIPLGDWTFDINRLSLRRIINNLASNAFKYNRLGGWVKVSLKRLNENGDKARIVLTVADSGKGISKEFLKTKLFTPFCQENLLSPGTGLGLSLVRQLVKVLEGRIDVTSQLGVGTVVAVELPVLVAKSANTQGSDAAAGGLDESLKGMVKGKKVLLMGFEQTNKDLGALGQTGTLEIVSEFLRSYATSYYEMDLAMDTGEAEIVIAADVDCIGIGEALKRHIPVIALCTASTPVTGTVGSITFLRNPIGPTNFTQALRIVVEREQIGKTIHMGERCFSPSAGVAPSSWMETPTPLCHTQYQAVPSVTAMKKLVHMSSLCQNPDPNKPTILAVEDNPINMRLLITFLARRGYPFSTAHNGLEALNSIKANRKNGGYNIILMDLQMPVLSGTETTREIRSMERLDSAFKRSYIIAFTGLAAATDKQEAFLAGVDAFVVKPAKFGELEGMWMDQLKLKT